MKSLRRSDSQRLAVRQAALEILLPLAGLLLDAKMTIGDFTALAKISLVQAAVLRARAGGELEPRPSEIAVETGLSRNDVPKLMSARATRPPPFRRGRASAERVLSGWWNDPQFRDDLGRPAALDRSSFVTLIQRYSVGNKRAAPIIKELLRAGAAERLKDGRLKPIKPTCVNVQWDRQSLEQLGAQVRRHLSALVHNLTQPKQEVRFARAVESEALDPVEAGVLLKELRESAEILLEGATDSFSRIHSTRRTAAASGKRIALAIQLLEEPIEAHRASGASSARRRPRRTRIIGTGSRSPRGVGVS